MENNTNSLDNNNPDTLEKRKPNKFAKFLTILGIFAFLGGVVCTLAPFASILYVLVLAVLLIITLGLLLFDDKFRSLFDKSEDFMGKAIKMSEYIPYFAGASIGLCALSFLLLLASKKASHRTSGLVINGVLIFLNIVLIIIRYTIKFNLG
ncbi:MAG TPA: hypothetical protein VIL24_06810 [Clostridia bacterium]